MRRYIFWLIFIGCLWAFFEVLSFSTPRLLEKFIFVPSRCAQSLSQHQNSLLERMLELHLEYITYSSSLGWTIKSNAKAVAGLYTSNSQGIRADERFDPIPKPDMLRVAAFGDSFTHADDVANADAWATRLSHLVPYLEVLNFGVPGYGLDQAFLRYQQEGVLFHPHIVMIGFMPENIYRDVNVFRP